MDRFRARIERDAASEEVAAARLAVENAREHAHQAKLNAERVLKREIRELLKKGFHPSSFEEAFGVSYAHDIAPIKRE